MSRTPTRFKQHRVTTTRSMNCYAVSTRSGRSRHRFFSLPSGLGQPFVTRSPDYTGMWVRRGSTNLMTGKVVFLRGLLSPIRVEDLTLVSSLTSRVEMALFRKSSGKQYKFFMKTLEDITLSAFELRKDEGKNLSPEEARKINIHLDRNEACFQPGGEHTPFIEHRFDTGDQTSIATYPYRMNPGKKQDCQKENFDRRRKKYYKPGDKVWVTIQPINRNNKSRKFMFEREDPYLILSLRSPVTYEIADPANSDQTLGTYYVSALKDYQEPETKRNTGFVAPLRKRGRPKKKLPPGSEPRRQRNQNVPL
ncbi:transposon Ty3-I Gag-Pol polyprotein [Trichonephila clavipes]|nr:transposon Ty3-I Gag-Pol polyprotein [Trichonephila clavipes]